MTKAKVPAQKPSLDLAAARLAKAVASRTVQAAAAANAQRTRLIEDMARLCDDAGISRRALAREAGVSRTYLDRIFDATTRPSLETYARLGSVLGADLVARLYPNTGPTIRDHLQARILEALVAARHPRWQPFTEVIVRKPVRGAIDLAIFDQRERLIVSTEIQSELRRIEQIVRWSREKSDALASWSGWAATCDPRSGEPPRVSQLLVVRATRTTRRVATEFARQLAVAYPGHPQDALAALNGTATWPGSAIVWARVDREGVRFLPAR